MAWLGSMARLTIIELRGETFEKNASIVSGKVKKMKKKARNRIKKVRRLAVEWMATESERVAIHRLWLLVLLFERDL